MHYNPEKHIEMVSQAVVAAALTARKITPHFMPVIKIYTKDEITNIMKDVRGISADEDSRPVEKRYRDYPAMVGIGAEITRRNVGFDCGACGFPTCAEFNKAAKDNKGTKPGPSCNWLSFDLGIACDYGTAMAYFMGVQTRVNDVIGMKIIEKDLLPGAEICSALPLSCEAKNPQFEARKEGVPANQALIENAIKRIFPSLNDLSVSDILQVVVGHKLSPLLASEITELDKT